MRGEMTMPNCKYCYGEDEVCVNPDCPMVTEWCHLMNWPDVCKFEDRSGDDD